MRNEMASAGAEAAGEVLFWEEQRWRGLQSQRLAEHVRRAGRSVLYRRLGLEEMVRGVAAGNLGEVLRRLPLTTKDQLAHAGADAWGIAAHKVREWVCTSGTAGRALDVPLSEGDLDRLAENEAAAFSLAGVRPGDVLLLAVAMDRMFVAGLAYWLGGRRLGASCVRVGPLAGAVAEVVGRLGAGAQSRVFVVAVPSFLAGASVPQRRLEGIIAIGEAVRNADLTYNVLGRRLRERFGCSVMSTYASTETCTTFAEGPGCLGGHLNPRLGLVEILDEAGGALADGEVGEVVVTPLGVEAMPLMRFRTGDMAALFAERCGCGRTTPRLGPIVGRRQQLLKIRGTSVYPAAIVEALRGVEAVEDWLVVAERDEFGGDRVVVFVLLKAKAAAVSGVVEGRLAAVLRVTPEVRYVEAAALAELHRASGSRKVQRFVDKR